MLLSHLSKICSPPPRSYHRWIISHSIICYISITMSIMSIRKYHLYDHPVVRLHMYEFDCSVVRLHLVPDVCGGFLRLNLHDACCYGKRYRILQQYEHKILQSIQKYSNAMAQQQIKESHLSEKVERYIAVCRPHQYRAISLTMTNARRLLVYIISDVIIIIVIDVITIIIVIIDIFTIIISFIIIVGLHRPSHCPLVCSQCA